MDYTEARQYIDTLKGRSLVMGLAAETELLRRLGNPQDSLRFVHIAGTNGKGAVLAYLESVLERAGYRVGRYISPTLFSYRERIQRNGVYISREDFARMISMISEHIEAMKTEGRELPSAFETETAAAFCYFRETGCDFVLLECGMGGRTQRMWSARRS